MRSGFEIELWETGQAAKADTTYKEGTREEGGNQHRLVNLTFRAQELEGKKVLEIHWSEYVTDCISLEEQIQLRDILLKLYRKGTKLEVKYVDSKLNKNDYHHKYKNVLKGNLTIYPLIHKPL